MSTGRAKPGTWIDISVPLEGSLVRWPGDPEFRVERISDVRRGDECNLSQLSMCAHTGTHVDAPRHFIADGTPVDELPLEATVGRARVIAVDTPHAIHAADLVDLGLQRGERVLFKTRNSGRAWHRLPFDNKFVHLAPDAAELLARCGVRVVGIDYLSVGCPGSDGAETHRVLLGAGIWVIEGLNLADVEPGEYELVCLPLRIVGADGAPARAILRPV